MFSDFFPVFWVRVNGLGAWNWGSAGRQRRANATRGNLDSRLDSGVAEVLLAKHPQQGLCGTCPPLVAAKAPLRTRGAYASFIVDRCKSIKMKGSCVCACVCMYTSPGQSSSAKALDPTVPFCKKNNNSANKGTGPSRFPATC